jgi:teichuronic acid biosynthesis glycosyltransferase TuaC
MMRVLFVAGGNNPHFEVAPFIRAQADSLIKKGIEIDYYLITRKGIRGYLSHIAPLRHKIRTGNYHLVHAHYTFCGWVAWLARPGIPLVVSYMGSDTYGSVDHRGRLRFKSIPMIAQGVLLNFFANAIIVKSQNLLRMILLKQKASVIPNGVDFDLFRPMEKGEARKRLHLTPDGQYLLFAGNPSDPRKNYALAARAIEQMPDHMAVQLMSPYPIPHHEVMVWMNACDLLISTSWLEGSPNVIKEALACNCPVITTPAGDAADLVAGVNNCYVTTFDPEELASRISMVLSTQARSDGREKRKHLSSSMIADRIIAIYQRIARKS